mgnify:FL=1
MTEPIIIDMPKDHLDFDIDGDTFTASFADKSVAKYAAEYRRIEHDEVANQQKIEKMQTQITLKLDQLDRQRLAFDDESVASQLEENVSPLSETNYVIAKQKLDREYIKKFDDLQQKQERDSKDRYVKWLDQLFGVGSGNKIYIICGTSIVVLAKVVTQITTALNKETNLLDYRTQLASQIDELKDEESSK